MTRSHPIASIVRLAAAVLLAGSAVVFAPAVVEAEPTITFQDCPRESPEPTPTPTPDPEAEPTPTPTPEGCMPEEQAILRGEVELGFTVDAGGVNRIQRVELFVLSEEDGIPSPGFPGPGNPVQVWDFPERGEAPTEETFLYPWDTDSLTPYNGFYQVRIRAYTHSPDSTTSSATRERLNVDNPPVRPNPPRVVVATENGVRVEWSQAPEPDLLYYRLHWTRTASADQPPPADAFRDSKRVFEREFFHETSEQGAYWYKLRVFRRSTANPEGAVSSELSERSAEPGVVIQPTPSPGPQSGSRVSRPTNRRSPRLTSRTLPRSSRSRPGVPDAPFSATLPYDLSEGAPAEGEFAEFGPGEETEGDPGSLPFIAVGVFLFSAALALGRMPT